MKVIHLISGGDTGGAKTHVHSLLHGLGQKRRGDARLLPRRALRRGGAALGIDTRVYSGRFFSALGEVEELIRSERLRAHTLARLARQPRRRLLSRRTRLPVVSTVHSDWKLDYLGRPLAAATYGVLNAWALRRIKYHIGVSDAMRAPAHRARLPPERHLLHL